jgi:predicted nucleic acid-binding protein
LSALLDTNVLREIWRSNGIRTVRAAVAALSAESTFVSVITIGEVARGIREMPQSPKRTSLANYLAATEAGFGDRILPITPMIAHRWGELTARSKLAGKVIPPTDGLIAATALHHGLSVMTRNVRDFSETGVTVINPWTE